jgi:hypothetical protein
MWSWRLNPLIGQGREATDDSPLRFARCGLAGTAASLRDGTKASQTHPKRAMIGCMSVPRLDGRVMFGG